MRNLPLSVQIWLVFAGITLAIFTMIAAFLPWTLRSFFDRQLYDMLQDAQKSLILFEAPAGGSNELFLFRAKEGTDTQPVVPAQPLTATLKVTGVSSAGPVGIALKTAPGPQGPPVISHFLMSDAIKLPQPPLPAPFVQVVKKDALEQQEDVKTYSQEINNKTLFYVIRKELVQEKPGYMVSFAWSSYRNDLVMSMYGKLLLLMGALFLLIWPASLWLARYLSRPLVQMESHISRIAGRDWHEPIVTDRKDEIGRLSRSFENMRRRLIRQDQAQQSFLQHASHQLKTPVMVIRSYAQSILDGIFPRGSLDESIKVISSEAGRLEKQVHDLLYLTKLNYLSAREKKCQSFNLAGMVEERVERHRCRGPELSWEVDLQQLTVYGDRDLWGVAVENLIDNQIRYAAGRVAISLYPGEEAGSARLRVWNDGPPIDPETLESLFEPYKTGKNGQFGLGMTIVRQITELHRARVRAVNENEGVAFYIDIDAQELPAAP
jgi:two-component system sensor histidine kinase CssS